MDDVKASGFGRIADPSNGKTFDNLRYVFEYDIDDDEEPSEAHPFFFHYKDAIKDDASLNQVADLVSIYNIILVGFWALRQLKLLPFCH